MTAIANVASSCLTAEENELLFTLIGNRRQSKATAVVQMFHAHSDRNQWTKFRTGIVCFVKDNVKKSYYIRLFDLTTKAVVYEQEMYNQFSYKKDCAYFHSFPGDKFTVGLNFAEEKEASKFYEAVEAKLQEREKRAALRKTKNDSNATVKKARGLRRPKRIPKLTKADVSPPNMFRHLSHVGFDPSTGTFDSSNISPEWKKLLDYVGVTDQLEDKNVASFIYDFVEKHGGIREANQQLEAIAPPPPCPAPQTAKGESAPPPPPRGGSLRGKVHSGSDQSQGNFLDDLLAGIQQLTKVPVEESPSGPLMPVEMEGMTGVMARAFDRYHIIQNNSEEWDDEEADDEDEDEWD